MNTQTILPRAKAVADKSSATLWALCSPQPHDAFVPPWSSVASELWSSLDTALTIPADRAIATAAARLGYTNCIRTLRRRLPAVYQIMTDIRGLILATAPKLVNPEKDRRGALVTPGEVLVYVDEPWT